MEFNMPIVKGIKSYLGANPVAFHMPGHKLGKGLSKEVFNDITAMDLTEIPYLDNLHFPEGIIEQAQKLAANAFGAEETFFLVNGSTCGIHAIIMTICRPGDKLIVSRDCHKSVINGMMLAGVEPIYISPGYDEAFGIPTVIAADNLKESFENNPDCVGVLITRPNYYGVCSDLKEIADITHSYNKILAVDEAHGSHLKFNKKLPQCAMELGADICVQSAHKTLPALTQGAFLHVKSQKIDVERLKFNLNILQTTSPSYIIMSALDYSRALMEIEGEALLDKLIDNIDWFNNSLKSYGEFNILSDEKLEYGCMDKTRIVINVIKNGITGYKVEMLLRENYNIQVEMSDYNNIVCIATVSDIKEAFEKLLYGLGGIYDKTYRSVEINKIIYSKYNLPERAVLLKDIFKYKSCKLGLKEAVGKVCRGTITPYPPGVPVICPGELIKEEAVEEIINIIKYGGKVNGVSEDNKIEIIDIK
ncbi:MAG: aminotransferase class I/II-fold pyridoxal phosphate-dependent enzyme [Bacillota bacterium]|nr:aminotransferase class I/II-fold pyridoxal phosphate-dependent enzyme [Bacillota bacterium]